MAVKFLHCADLHLGSVLSTAPSEKIAIEAPYLAFDSIIDVASREKVDFVLMAGDLVDQEGRALYPLLRLREGFYRLLKENITVFLVFGNHDPYSVMDGLVEFPENVTVFPPDNDKWHELTVCDGSKVAIWGASFRNSKESRNLTRSIPRIEGDYFRIVLLHQSVGIIAHHIPYAPCALADCDDRAHYWALGHIHKPQILSKNPFVVYSGTPQGRNIKERGERGCYLVEASGCSVIQTRFIQTCCVEWHEVEMDVSSVESVDGLFEKIAESVEMRSSQIQADIICRLKFTGLSTVVRHAIVTGQMNEIIQRLNEELSKLKPWIFISDFKDLTSIPVDFSKRKDLQDLLAYILKHAEEIINGQSRGEAVVDALQPLYKRADIRNFIGEIDEKELSHIVHSATSLLYEMFEGDKDDN